MTALRVDVALTIDEAQAIGDLIAESFNPTAPTPTAAVHHVAVLRDAQHKLRAAVVDALTGDAA